MNIAVVGAGISGISSAFRIKLQHPQANVVVISKDFSPNTTSDVAAGFWEPYIAADTPIELVKRWSKETYDFVIEKIRTDKESGRYGFMTTHGFNISEEENLEIPYWSDIVYDFRVLSKDELKKRFPGHVKSGIAFTTVFIEGSKYIPYLSKKFVNLGGKIIQGEIKSLNELGEEYDIVVNCTGLGSKELLNDQNMYPVRGQVMRVKAPWLRDFIICDGKNTAAYILPNQDWCVVGGTKQINNFDKTVNQNDKESILNAAKLLAPSLEYAEILNDMVGLRPARNAMRVEREDIKVTTDCGKKKLLKVVHNYGHGGSGITVHWGCAGDVVAMVIEIINEIKLIKSKL